MTKVDFIKQCKLLEKEGWTKLTYNLELKYARYLKNGRVVEIGRN